MKEYLGIGFVILVFALSFAASVQMYSMREEIAAVEKSAMRRQVLMSAPVFQSLPSNTNRR